MSLGSDVSDSVVRISASLNIIKSCTYNSLEKIFFHLAKVMWETLHITLLIVCYIISRLDILLKFTDAPTQVFAILVIRDSFKLINFSFQIYHFL